MERLKNCITILLFFVAVAVCSDSGEIVTRDDKKCQGEDQPIECFWNYLVYFPHRVLSGAAENFMVSTHGYPKPVHVNISLHTTSGDLYTSASKVIQPEKLTKIPVFIDHDAPYSLEARISGLGESTADGKAWAFKNTSDDKISVTRIGNKLYIQSDRPMYKPKQTIKFRVLAIDHQLRPIEGKLDKVVILNPSGSRMRQWNDVTLEDGYASFELKTSEKPVLGKWKIEAFMKSYKASVQVELAKFVLPKFQVTVTPPSYILQSTKNIEAEVCAKYSYGKSVNGKMTATMCIKNHYYYWYRRDENEKEKCKTITKKIYGCTLVSTSFLAELKEVSRWSNYRVSFKATVKEQATGVELSSKKVDKEVSYHDVELSIESTKKEFKPGFPTSIKILAKAPDGTQVQDIKVNVRAKSSYGGKPFFEKEIQLKNGMHSLELLTPFTANKLIIRTTCKEKDCGEFKLQDLVLSPWYSPSNSFLSIEKSFKGIAKIGSFVDFKVHYTVVDPNPTDRTIYYSTICGGNIVDSGSFERTFIGTGVQPTTTTTTTTTTTASSGNTTDLPTPRPLIRNRDYYGGALPTRPPMPEGFTTSYFDFSFDVTKDMMPHCRMNVYYMRGQEIVADHTKFDVEDILENPVTMKFSKDEVRPGDSLKLQLQAAPNSKIAITAVDKSIHFLANGNDIKKDEINKIREALDIGSTYVQPNWRRCRDGYRKRRSFPPYHGGDDFVDSEQSFAQNGLYVMSSFRYDVRPCHTQMIAYRLKGLGGGGDGNGPAPVGSVPDKGYGGSSNSQKKKETRVRKDFPETWLWLDEKTSSDGKKEIEVTVPDTITSWYASAFAVSKSAGLGIANAANLRVFQPFFLSINLPYSVVRGEEVTVPAAVFSYLEDACISVKVTLAYSADYHMIAGPAAKACICGGRTATVLFRIIPRNLGKIPLRLTAETLDSNICAAGKKIAQSTSTADIVVRKLLVAPEGVKNSYTLSSFICPKDSPVTYFKLRRPQNLVSGSIYSKVSVIGDIMGSSLSNIDELLAMPYGCGEQNMLKFAPNIFIMNYLNNTNQVSGEIKIKALDYMRSGYQRELTYKHKDGSYSAFGERDKSGSTWLSAFVLKSYAQARPWIDIDEKEITHTSKWLQKLQGPDGCFLKVGSLHNKAMAGGVKSQVTLTAYIVISLLEADVSPKNKAIVEAAYSCVAKEFKSVEDSYSLSIMAYMYAMLKDNMMYERIMDKLDKLAVVEDGIKHWEESKDKNDENKDEIPWYYQARSTDIEQTAYVLLTVLEQKGKKGITDAVPIVRWLSKQRNDLGGWSSTQDTVLAMQALSAFAELSFGASLNMDIDISGDDSFQHSFKINKNNNLVLQEVEDIPVPGSLKVDAKGDGCALVQAIVRYNEKKVATKPSFAISVRHSTHKIGKLNALKKCYPQIVTVCASWLRTGESNMAIIDVAMVSGFEADNDYLEKLQSKSPDLKDIEIKGKNVFFYFNKIGQKDTCIDIAVHQTAVVDKLKEVPVKVYDYYDTEKSATAMYTFSKDDCLGNNVELP